MSAVRGLNLSMFINKFTGCGRLFEYPLGQCLPARGPRYIRIPLEVVRSSAMKRGINK